jgi:hypothetical protein
MPRCVTILTPGAEVGLGVRAFGRAPLAKMVIDFRYLFAYYCRGVFRNKLVLPGATGDT